MLTGKEEYPFNSEKKVSYNGDTPRKEQARRVAKRYSNMTQIDIVPFYNWVTNNTPVTTGHHCQKSLICLLV